eukprot:151576-Lingulodinium_polyedra.AAC.1
MDATGSAGQAASSVPAPMDATGSVERAASTPPALPGAGEEPDPILRRLGLEAGAMEPDPAMCVYCAECEM